MPKATDISLLTRRAEEVAICAHMLEERGIKPVSIAITNHYALICIDAAKTQRLGGKPAGCTWVNGGLFVVYQTEINNVLVKWLVPHFDAQHITKKVH